MKGIFQNILRGIAGLLAAALLFTAGCAGTEEGAGKEGGAAGGGVGGAGSETGILGSYTEQALTLPEAVQAQGESSFPVIRLMDDGSIGLLDEMNGLFCSQDRGQSWERRESGALALLSAQSYISSLALSPDGSIAAVYVPLEGETEPGDAEEGAAEKGDGGNADWTPQHFWQNGQGERWTVPYADAGDPLNGLYFGNDSRLYGVSMSGKVWALDGETGTAAQIFEVRGICSDVCFTENYMAVFSDAGAALYDLEAGELKTDKVLDDFVADHVQKDAEAGVRSIVAAAGEGDVIYMALAGGIYRHTAGGSSMEQVTDGSRNLLGNPMSRFLGMAVLPEDVFLILYQGPQLCQYAYDAGAVAVPGQEISIYSLYEDNTIRQAVSQYQRMHPELYVRYEVGITGENGVTPEDAVKNLNMQLAAGEGPDLLVLDGLPEASYREKGLLMELDGLTAGLTDDGGIFPNLEAAMRTGGKLYSLPVRFALPLLVGNEEELRQSADLTSLADMTEPPWIRWERTCPLRG